MKTKLGTHGGNNRCLWRQQSVSLAATRRIQIPRSVPVAATKQPILKVPRYL